MSKVMDMAMLAVFAIGGYYLINNPGALDNIFSALKIQPVNQQPTTTVEDSGSEEDEASEDEEDKDSKFARALHGRSLYEHHEPSHLTGIFSDVNAGVISKVTNRYQSLRAIRVA